MAAHFRLVIAFSVGNLLVALAAASKLIVIEVHTQAGTIRDSHRAIVEWDAATRDNFVFRGLPGAPGEMDPRALGSELKFTLDDGTEVIFTLRKDQ